MNAKRGNGEGSVYQRKDGKWCASVVAPDPVTGEAKRTVKYGKTRAEAKAKLRDALARVAAGAPVSDARATVGSWAEQWCRTTLAASSRKPATVMQYRNLSRVHIEPTPFGSRTLDKLRPNHVEALIVSLRERGLSDSTIRSIYTVLRAVLDGAVRDGLIARNPAAAVPRPGLRRKEARYLDRSDVAALLAACRTSRYWPVLVLIAATGMRRGEALALQWADVDLAECTVRVRGTLARIDGKLVVTDPKSSKSRRTVHLSAPLVALLRQQRKDQATERLYLGEAWAGGDWVFATPGGTPIEPRNVLRVVDVAAKRLGLEGVSVHTLRHSAATALLEDGTRIEVVSELLGHSSIGVTGDIYAHVSDDAARAASDALASALGL